MFLCTHPAEVNFGSCCPKEKRICCVSCEEDCDARCYGDTSEQSSCEYKEGSE